MSVETFRAFQPALFEAEGDDAAEIQQPIDFGADFDTQVAELYAEAERLKGLQSGLGQSARDGFISEGTLLNPDNIETD